MKKAGIVQLSSVKKQKQKNLQWFPVSLKTKSKFLTKVDRLHLVHPTPALTHMLCCTALLCPFRPGGSSAREEAPPRPSLAPSHRHPFVTIPNRPLQVADLPPAPHHLVHCLHWSCHSLNIFIICYETEPAPCFLYYENTALCEQAPHPYCHPGAHSRGQQYLLNERILKVPCGSLAM